MKSYTEILQILFSLSKSGMKLGLLPMQQLCNRFDNPQNSFATIHVGGTNGKGSVSTKIAEAHRLQGLKVGLYTSPHISTFRERILINGALITEADVTRHLNAILPLLTEIPASFFEITTLLAFLFFAEQKVDIAVIEVGLGGRLDATNVITPRLSIITSISRDHTEILGNSLDEIAREKAGIVKPNVPVVIGPRVPKEPVLEKGAPCFQVQGEFENYDAENRAIAAEALKQLNVPIQGLEALPPCRIQQIQGLQVPTLLDVGHNPDGLRFLFASLPEQFQNNNLHVVCGLSANKERAACLQHIVNSAAHVHLVAADHPRAAPTELLAAAMPTRHFTIHSSVAAGIRSALKVADALIICGSFFMMDEAREALGLSFPRDAEKIVETLSPSVL